MKASLYCVYDSKAEVYMRPFVAQSNAAAIRSFADEVNSKSSDSVLAAHPEDYVLFMLAHWDECNGVLDVLEAKRSLGVGIDFVRDNTVPRIGAVN